MNNLKKVVIFFSVVIGLSFVAQIGCSAYASETNTFSGLEIDKQSKDYVKFKDTRDDYYLEIEKISENTYRVSDSFGKVYVIERASDGKVYVNGEVQNYSVTPTNPNPNRIHIGTTKGQTSDKNALAAQVMFIITTLLGLGYGSFGAFVGLLDFIISLFDKGSGAYYIQDCYVLPLSSQLEFVTKYYKNSDYTGYIETVTEYRKY